MDAIPLASPDGTVFAWACGRCRHVKGGSERTVDYAAEEIQYFADASRRDAERCCTCQGRCGTYVPISRFWSEGGHFCETCWPLEQERSAEALRKYATAEKARLARQDESLASARDRDAARRLVVFMSTLSEDYHCAGWNSGIEYELWDACEKRDATQYQAHELKTLRSFSDEAGGWWYWDDEIHEALFVTLDEWRSKCQANDDAHPAG